jgi:hypothetical protein
VNRAELALAHRLSPAVEQRRPRDTHNGRIPARAASRQ